MFECVDGEAEVGKFGLHQIRVARLACQTHRNVPKRPCVHVIVVNIGPNGNGAQVRWDGVIQFPRAEQGVPAQGHLFDQMPLVVGTSPVGCAKAIGVGGALHEVVETRVPHPSKIGRDRRQPNAEVVDQIAGEVHAAPIRVAARLSAVPNFQHNLLADLHRGGRVNVELRFQLREGHGFAIPMDAVDHKGLEVPPHRGSPALQDGEVYGGESLHGLAPVVGHVEHEVVVDHVETVAPRNARPHVEIVVDKQGFGGRHMVLATEGMTPLGKERGAQHLSFLVKARQGGLGQGLGGLHPSQKRCRQEQREKGAGGLDVHAPKLDVLSLHEESRPRSVG